MACVRSLCLVATTLLTFSEARGFGNHKHEAINIKQRRQANSPAQVPAVSTPTALTTIYPSPGASPILVTSQNALVTTFIPQFTLCELPPIEGFTATASVSTVPTSPPFLGISFSTPPGNGSCTTIYSAEQSIVCATQLTDLTTTYTVTNCNQDITFSTEYGYSLILPTPTTSYANIASSPTGILVTPPPSIQTLTTYFLAGWQALTKGGPPTDVDYKICESFPNGTESCILEYYKWKTSLLTLTSQVTTSINLTTTIPGPSQLLVETFVANVTGTATAFSMFTTMELETSTLSETTQVSTRGGSTATSTVYLQYASSSQQSTRTTTVHLTLTTTAGTSTVYLTRSTSLPAAPSVETPSVPAQAVDAGSYTASIPASLQTSLPASAPTLPAAPLPNTLTGPDSPDRK